VHAPLKPDNYYGASKLTGELYIHIADLPLKTILRFGNVYGPRQIPIGENQVIARMLNHLMYGEDFYIFGDGKQKRDFIYVGDVAQAVIKAIGQRSGAFNIAGGASHSINEVGKLLAKIYGLPGYDWEYDRKRTDERKNVRMQIERAELNLDWKPETDLESGLKQTVEWWKECQDEPSL
jgi:UDP-glucose 4-epimerase